MVNEVFFTQDFLEYMAQSTATIPSVFSKGNINGCTITEQIVLGPPATRTGKKYKTKSSQEKNRVKLTSDVVNKETSNYLWDFSTSPNYQTTTDYFYQSAPSLNLGQTIFEKCFNSDSTYIAYPCRIRRNLISSDSDDYSGTTTSIYWEWGGTINNIWNYTVGNPTIINGSNIGLVFNASTIEYQCTMPAFAIGYDSNIDLLPEEYKKPFQGYIIVNDRVLKDDDTQLVLYGGILEEEVETGGVATSYQTIISMDVLII